MTAQKIDFQDAVISLRAFAPDLVGTTLYTFNFHPILDLLRKFKTALGCKILVGGAHLSHYPAEVLTHETIDYAVIGDAEKTLPELVSALLGERELSSVEGIGYREKGEGVLTQPRDPEPDLSLLPLPARHLIDNSKYFSIFSRKKSVTGMITMRACPYQCPYCIHSQKSFASRSPEQVVQEMEHCLREFGIREFKIYDACFTFNRKRTLKIADLLIEKNLGIEWWVKTRVDKVDFELLQRMKEAGCTRIDYGIESGEEAILNSLNRGITIAQVRQVVSQTRSLGILTAGYFMLGIPGETNQSAHKTIELANSLDLDLVQFCGLVYFPGTEIYQNYVDATGDDYWRDYTISPQNEKILPYLETPITPQKAMLLVRKGYRKFYFSPKRILRVLSMFSHPIQYWRLFLAALRLLLPFEKENP
jgi:radical SAM superfamily enzyme YgiQ (UPF0313 family)